MFAAPDPRCLAGLNNRTNIAAGCDCSTVGHGKIALPIVHRDSVALQPPFALFMSLIHTCELNRLSSFEYLTELLRHAGELNQKPSAWLPWNYRDNLARFTAPSTA